MSDVKRLVMLEIDWEIEPNNLAPTDVYEERISEVSKIANTLTEHWQKCDFLLGPQFVFNSAGWLVCRSCKKQIAKWPGELTPVVEQQMAVSPLKFPVGSWNAKKCLLYNSSKRWGFTAQEIFWFAPKLYQELRYHLISAHSGLAQEPRNAGKPFTVGSSTQSCGGLQAICFLCDQEVVDLRKAAPNVEVWIHEDWQTILEMAWLAAPYSRKVNMSWGLERLHRIPLLYTGIKKEGI